MRLWRRKPAHRGTAPVAEDVETDDPWEGFALDSPRPRSAADRVAAAAYIDAAIRRHEQGRPR